MSWIKRFLLAVSLLALLLAPGPNFSELAIPGPIAAALARPASLVLMVFCIALASVGLSTLLGGRAPKKANSTAVTRAVALPALRIDKVDREFLPAALELLETPPSPVRVAAIWAICLFFAAALAWSYFGWLEIYAVAQGRIQPSGRSKVVQPLDAGRVVGIAVENGSRVAAGDLLVELDSRETGADREEQERDLESALAEAARRRVAIAAARLGDKEALKVVYPAAISNDIIARENGVLAAELVELSSNRANLLAQKAERLATRGRLKASLAAREKLIAVNKEHVDMRESLSKTKAASRAQVIETLQQYEAQVTSQAGEKGQLLENEAALITLDRKLEEAITQFIADQMQKLADSERKADHLKGELIKATTKHERTRLTAPNAGTVQQLAVTTVGQVVSSGQPLMIIVPSGAPIEIEALIQNKDIGFVEVGQPAVVKVESFPFTRYGTVEGTVVKVSRDAVDDHEASALSDPKSSTRPQSSVSDLARNQNLVFPAIVTLGKTVIKADGKNIPLSPGMAVTVEVLTGKRRALDYILSPLREVTSSSAHER
jgi:hemolysin D